MYPTKLYGLVLAGGKSSRMGRDKGEICYHEEPQRIHAYKLLDVLCERTFLSVREDQENQIAKSFGTITDLNNFRGPFNGIMSAHYKYPEVAWLVLATDLPLLATKDVLKLIKNRNYNFY